MSNNIKQMADENEFKYDFHEAGTEDIAIQT